MEKKVFKMNFRGRELVVEHGEVAKQAHGAVLVRYGDTVIQLERFLGDLLKGKEDQQKLQHLLLV